MRTVTDPVEKNILDPCRLQAITSELVWARKREKAE